MFNSVRLAQQMAKFPNIKNVIKRLKFCMNSKPPLVFEAAAICHAICHAPAHKHMMVVTNLGWEKGRLSKLTRISRNATLMKHQSDLPNVTSALYEICRIDEDVLERLIRDKEITRKTTAVRAREIRLAQFKNQKVRE
ncbi:hypothetical protein HYPGJ_20118 [Hyphomicrobium sp. GJ21]|nr:hypothetical protein HYPGJ_20118 [Hyphomicrobium sp. GJ21]